MGDTAGSHIARARRAAGLSQAALAARLDVTQATISDYERGRRDPSFATLQRMLAATGHRLVVVGAQRSPRRAAVDAHLDELRRELAARGARELELFGSVARGDDTEGSDIDLLVRLSPGVSLFDLAEMELEAERILGFPVDIVPVDSLRSTIAERVAVDRIVL